MEDRGRGFFCFFLRIGRWDVGRLGWVGGRREKGLARLIGFLEGGWMDGLGWINWLGNWNWYTRNIVS